MNAQAKFHFYDSLNDFLPAHKRHNWITYTFKGLPALKDAIEAIGIPHPEVDVILQNQQPVEIKQALHPEDQVEVYPSTLPGSDLHPFSLQAKLPATDKFILDVHLGKLAKYLRLLGFDTYFDPAMPDGKVIATLAAAENRALLTRDVGLLKHKEIQRGYWLRSQNPTEQVHEIITYFQLGAAIKPFTRCLACNSPIQAVSKETVFASLPPQTKLYFQEFYQCPTCTRVYWKGSHFSRMEGFIQQLKTTLGLS